MSNWLDHNDFTSVEEAEKSLLSLTVISELISTARKAYRRTQEYVPELETSTQFSLLAGRGIDLSGQLVCRSDICRKRQVDELFGRVWHYFDRIVVNDNLAREVHLHWHDEDWKVRDSFLSNLRVLFYLREIGAEDLVEFRPKPFACTVHWDQHAREAGLVHLASHVDELVAGLLPNATIRPRKNSQNLREFRLSHPLLEVTHRVVLDEQTTNGLSGTLELQAMTIVVRRLIAHLSSDIAASHRYAASLGAVLKTHEIFLHQLRPTSVADVVLNLKLPVLEGLPTWDLIEIRRDEKEYFDRFRDSLTKTISERIKSDSDSDATAIAEELRMDLIEPRLRDIRSRLSAAQKLMTKKSSVGLFLGALSTTCGILSGLEPQTAALAGTGVAIACAGNATAKYLDEAKDISLDDMYFLWKATECAPHEEEL